MAAAAPRADEQVEAEPRLAGSCGKRPVPTCREISASSLNREQLWLGRACNGCGINGVDLHDLAIDQQKRGEGELLTATAMLSNVEGYFGDGNASGLGHAEQCAHINAGR